MVQINDDSVTGAVLVNLGLGVVSHSIAIESTICQVIDNNHDTDWMESVLFLTQKLADNIKTIMETDIDAVKAYRVPLLAYSHSIESMCLRVINDGDELNTVSEAILHASRIQRTYIDQLMLVLSDL